MRRRGASSTCKQRAVGWARRGESSSRPGSSASPPPGIARAAGQRERHSPARPSPAQPGPSGGKGPGKARTPPRPPAQPPSLRSVSLTPRAVAALPARGSGRRAGPRRGRRRRRCSTMLAGLGRALRSGTGQLPLLLGRRDGCLPPSAPQRQELNVVLSQLDTNHLYSAML
ncbi:atherin-like [Motacilla alba alba]|uniref:atherin-like n=1 Tax=Motacilla alba alba TaxID=1094192 RepID=UPI0018D564C2|nr:atherin-like [Motacilla alba alba]